MSDLFEIAVEIFFFSKTLIDLDNSSENDNTFPFIRFFFAISVAKTRRIVTHQFCVLDRQTKH